MGVKLRVACLMLFAASAADLQEVDGVGESRARIIRDGLVRLADAAYSEQLD